MRKRTKVLAFAAAVAAAAAAVWIGGAALWRWLLAMHGVH